MPVSIVYGEPNKASTKLYQFAFSHSESVIQIQRTVVTQWSITPSVRVTYYVSEI